MPNSTKKCLTKSEISKMGPDYHGMKNASPELKLQPPLPYRPTHQTDIKVSPINFKINPLFGM